MDKNMEEEFERLERRVETRMFIFFATSFSMFTIILMKLYTLRGSVMGITFLPIGLLIYLSFISLNQSNPIKNIKEFVRFTKVYGKKYWFVYVFIVIFYTILLLT